MTCGLLVRALPAAVLAALAAGLAACGGDATEQHPAAGASGPATTQTTQSLATVPAPTTSPARESTAVTTSTVPIEPGRGRAISVSDVSGIPDSLVTSGSVLFVEQARTGELAALSGVDLSDANASRHARFSVDADNLAALGAVAVPLDDKGRFPIDVGAGSYLVCLADTFPGDSPGPPYSVVGCDRAELASDAGLELSFGEGGVEATTR